MGRPIDILYIWHIYFSSSVNVPRKTPFPLYNYEILLILRGIFATACVNRPYFDTTKPRNSRLIIMKTLLIFRLSINKPVPATVLQPVLPVLVRNHSPCH